MRIQFQIHLIEAYINSLGRQWAYNFSIARADSCVGKLEFKRSNHFLTSAFTSSTNTTRRQFAYSVKLGGYSGWVPELRFRGHGNMYSKYKHKRV